VLCCNLAAFSAPPIFAFSFLIMRFPGALFPLSAGGPDAFPSGVMLFPSQRLMFSGSSGFVFPTRSLPFPQGCLFVRRHPGRPAP
jgi:hypothetical protein